jgi:hypothetical protein
MFPGKRTGGVAVDMTKLGLGPRHEKEKVYAGLMLAPTVRSCDWQAEAGYFQISDGAPDQSRLAAWERRFGKRYPPRTWPERGFGSFADQVGYSWQVVEDHNPARLASFRKGCRPLRRLWATAEIMFRPTENPGQTEMFFGTRK